MSKRRAESFDLPSKRVHVEQGETLPIHEFIPREVLLRALSYLGPADLASVERCSHFFSQLANDSLLWRSLLQRDFPSKSRDYEGAHRRRKTYKTLYKIASNWSTGYAKSSAVELRSSVLDSRLPIDCHIAEEDHVETVVPHLSQRPEKVPERQGHSSRTIVQFHQHFIFTAQKGISATRDLPSIQVFVNKASGETMSLCTIKSRALEEVFAKNAPSTSAQICDMRLDETSRYMTSSDLKNNEDFEIKSLALFYSTGHFCIFSIQFLSDRITWEEEYAKTDIPNRVAESGPTNKVLLSKFRSPLLVTFTEDFQLGIWLVSKNEDTNAPSTSSSHKSYFKSKAELTQPSLRSTACWWPVVLSLSPQQSGECYKITLAYSTPFFPYSWTVGVQEFEVFVDPLVQGEKPQVSVFSRHAVALPTRNPSIPFSPVNHFTLSPTSPLGESVSSNSSVVTSIEHSDPWVVTSKSDNTIQVFRIVSSSSSNSISHALSPNVPGSVNASSSLINRESEFLDSSPFRETSSAFQVSHYQTLFGHTASVDSISVDDNGRCVSGGADGKVKVWSLMPSSISSSQLFEPNLSSDSICHNKTKDRNVQERVRTKEVEVTERNTDDEEGTADTSFSTPRAKRTLRSSRAHSKLTPISSERIRWLGFDHSRIVSLVSPQRNEASAVDDSDHSCAADEAVKIWNFE